MIFNSFNFLVVFPLLFLFYYVIPARKRQARNMYLLIAGYLLYMNFQPVYALILLGVTAVTFFVAKSVEDYRGDSKRLLLFGGGNSYTASPFGF